MNFTVSGAGEYTVISLGDASVEIDVAGSLDDAGNSGAERSVDVSQVVGDVTVTDTAGSGDITIVGGDGLLTADVSTRDESGSTVTVVAGDGGSDVSGGALSGGDTLAVMGGDGDDAVEVLSVSGASAVALLGDGDNTLTLGDVNDGGEVELTAGAGDDTFTIAGGADFASGSSVTITLGAGDNELVFSGDADISNSGASITITGLETIDFGDSGSDISVQAALLDGQSYMLIGGVSDGNGSGGAAAGLSGASGGQVQVVLASGGDDVDFSDLDLVGLPGLQVSGGADSGDYTVVGSEGDDDFNFKGNVSGDLTITGGKGSDEFWLDGTPGESVTLIFAVGDSNVVGVSGDTIDVVQLGDSGGITSGSFVFDFNLSAATDDNFFASGGSGGTAATNQLDAIDLASNVFAANTDLKYVIIDDGTDSWLFVDSKGDEAPEIGIKIVGLSDATNFTIDNISS
jgi:hypothetical protein